jgi:hypothetical protein
VPLVWSPAIHAGSRGYPAEEALLSSDRVEGLTVRACDGRMIGVVVGLFTEGPLAGRLRVQGDYGLGRYPAGPQHGIAVYAIPRRAVVCQLHDSLVLDTTRRAARSRWLMHHTVKEGA